MRTKLMVFGALITLAGCSKFVPRPNEDAKSPKDTTLKDYLEVKDSAGRDITAKDSSGQKDVGIDAEIIDTGQELPNLIDTQTDSDACQLPKGVSPDCVDVSPDCKITYLDKGTPCSELTAGHKVCGKDFTCDGKGRCVDPCDDFDPCTNDQCGDPIKDSDGTTTGYSCKHSDYPCRDQDGIRCTVPQCQPCPYDEEMPCCVEKPDDSACDDGIACTKDTCDTEKGCLHSGDNRACRDKYGYTTDICCFPGTRSPDCKTYGIKGCIHVPGDCPACKDDSYCDDGQKCSADQCVSSVDCGEMICQWTDTGICGRDKHCVPFIGCVSNEAQKD